MRTGPSTLRSSFGLSAIVSTGVLLVYLKTLAPGITFIDAGELSTVAWTLGIAHPTGYPLFSIIGWCFAHLPLPVEPITRMNVMAAVFCSAGIFVFFHTIMLLLQEIFPEEDPEHDRLRRASATAASLILAFSETYWSQAVAVEVYSLHVFLISCVLYAFLRANTSDDGTGSARPHRWWTGFAFLLGLAFTNHMTTILLAPGFITYYFVRQGWNARSWKRILLLGAPFLAGLSAYLYLPIRGAEDPVMNWGAPTTLERFIWHVSGKQFRVWIFSSAAVAGKQLAYFLSSLSSEHAYIGLVLSIAGVIVLWVRSRPILLLSVVLFVTCVGYSINYDIHDIDSYFLLSYMMVAVWAGIALYAGGAAIRERRPGAAMPVMLLIVLIGLVPLAYNYRTSDESHNYLVEDYSSNMFSSLDSGAVVFSAQWDFWVSAAYYEQLVRGIRTDVTVIDKELLRRSWYLRQLEMRFPLIIEQSRPEMHAYMAELYKFEHDLPYDPATIEKRYAGLIMSLMTKSMVAHPVYVTSEIEGQYTGALTRVPVGLALRLYSDTAFHPTEFPEFTYRPLERRGMLEDATRRLYANAYLFRAEYYGLHGDLQEVEKSVKKCLFFDRTHPLALKWLGALSGRVR